MPRQNTDQPYEAVLFVQDHQVTKQLRFTEFEAILDGVVALNEFADREVSLVFAELTPQLKIQALVFFLLYFDEHGRADPEWNLPLRQLAKTAGPGPVIGSGPTRLCCRSQCPVNWHQKDMWDPSMKPGANDFQAIRRALEDNRLDFPVKVEAAPVAPVAQAESIPLLMPAARNDLADIAQGVSAEHRVRIARVIRAQRLRIKTLIGQHEEALAELNRQRRIEIQALKTELQSQYQRVEQYQVLNEQLKAKLDQRNEQYLALQDQLAAAKQRIRALEDDQERAKRTAQESGQRASDRLEAELVILKEQLDRRDVELFYRDEREARLRGEIEALKEELANTHGHPDVLRKLVELDVVFVVYHPGAGHLTIAPSDVERYAANPAAYAAEKCFVSEQQYRSWLAHHEQPICTHALPGGGSCGEPLPRITAPADYQAGRDNRCTQHRR